MTKLDLCQSIASEAILLDIPVFWNLSKEVSSMTRSGKQSNCTVAFQISFEAKQTAVWMTDRLIRRIRFIAGWGNSLPLSSWAIVYRFVSGLGLQL